MEDREYNVAETITQSFANSNKEAAAQLRAECFNKNGGYGFLEQSATQGPRLAGEDNEAPMRLGKVADCIKDGALNKTENVNVPRLVDRIMIETAEDGNRTARMNVTGVPSPVVTKMVGYIGQRGMTYKIDPDNAKIFDVSLPERK